MMDQIKYRKALPVYIVGMKSLEVKNPEIWNYLMERNFSEQKSDIPGVAAIACDHAGKQVNREDKLMVLKVGLKGITRNQNSSNWHYLAAPLLAQLQEMMNKGLAFLSSQSKHHQISVPYVHRQGIRVLKLFDVLKSHELDLENKQYHHIKNFVTRKVFPLEASQQMVDCEERRQNLR